MKPRGAEERVGLRASSAKPRVPTRVRAYVPCRDPEDPGSFLFYEQYRDKEAFEEHGASEHFQRLGVGELFGLMESRERTFYETV
jgi:hypothetical protein